MKSAPEMCLQAKRQFHATYFKRHLFHRCTKIDWGDGERSITEGLRTALARLRQRSTPTPPTSPHHQNPSTPAAATAPPALHQHQTRQPQSVGRSSSCSTSSSVTTTHTPRYTPSSSAAAAHTPTPSPRPTHHSTTTNRMTVNSQSGPRCSTNNATNTNHHYRQNQASTNANSTSHSPHPHRPSNAHHHEDLISTATSALRRLNFKTARLSTKATTKAQSQPVPKVIVMGSSTTSETTINTSTDSSNTIVTTMTATDGDNTEDSLDMHESLDYLNSDNVNHHHQVLQPMPVGSPKTPPTALQQTPPTAKKQETKFTFEVEQQLVPSLLKEAKIQIETNKGHSSNARKMVDNLIDAQVEALKMDARRRYSYRAAQNQEDLDRIDIVNDISPSSPKKFPLKPRVLEETTSKSKHRHKRSSRKHHSPSKYKKQQQSIDQFSYDETHIATYREQSRMTPPLPDLRVDFFNETVDRTTCHDDDSLFVPAGVQQKRGSVCLNKCLREAGAQLDSSSVNATATVTSPINVTTNPLENSVHFNSRKIPQATIVVQQPSLSLDQSSVSTILLKNGSDFLSNVVDCNNKLSLKKQKVDNMKQLLDVANNLTLEEIHDFEMRYGSPHHNRSQSVKTPGRSSGRPNYLCLPQQRARVASMPNTGFEEEYYRLRHFSITGKGVVNRGDSLKSRRSRSNNSVASSNSSTEQLQTAVSAGSAKTSATCSLASSRESSTSQPAQSPYKVLMLGGPSVGKSSLVSQFMTSEYLHAYDTSIDDESGEKSVSVLLAGEESELTFIDFATADLSPDSCIGKYHDPHAFCVVFSSADRGSLEIAEAILQTLWALDTISTKAVILVANKADLVRSRVVSTEEGKATATSYDCKYIETSVGINHNVDELLVGILSQIRLKLENPEKTRDLFRKRSSSKRNLNRNRSPLSGGGTPAVGAQQGASAASAQNSPKKYRGSRTSASLKVRSLLGKVWARDSKSKSCENLHVL